jgi:hypothetical protein
MSQAQVGQDTRDNGCRTKLSKVRLARTGLAVLASAIVAAAGVLLYLGQEPPQAKADPPVCTPPLPEPGPGRPWEASI